MTWAGLMGCNRGLIDSDLKLPAGAQLATVVINNAALDRLATYATDPTTIQVNAYGLNNTGRTSLNATYQDLFSNQTFDNSSSSWGYAHHTIHSLQDLNL
jgi:hypothetical protein